MDAVPLFSPDYSTARHRFRRAAALCEFDVRSHPIDELGPDGEELTIDVALSPGNSSDRMLVVSSGLHGVEGFFGSACHA